MSTWFKFEESVPASFAEEAVEQHDRSTVEQRHAAAQFVVSPTTRLSPAGRKQAALAHRRARHQSQLPRVVLPAATPAPQATAEERAQLGHDRDPT